MSQFPVTIIANNLGHALTITLDGKVLSSAIIARSIAGPFVIPVDLTQQQASAIVSVLKYGPLPIALKQQGRTLPWDT